MKNNAHVMEFCMDYINSQSNPEYALLLKGPWGCGKTFFVERLKERLTEGNKKTMEKENIWHISIFGVNTIEELEDKFFEAAHPIMSSKPGKMILTIGYKIVRSAAKCKYGLDPNELGFKDMIKTGGIGENCKLIIIDDIERSGLSPTQLLGYMLEIILKDGIRIVFIGNEEEFSKRFQKDNEEYSRVREKVIGYTFKIVPEYNAAIERFVEMLKLKEINVENINSIILDITKELKVQNLRVLKQTLEGLKLFYDKISNKHDKTYNEKLVRTYLILMIQVFMGWIKKEDNPLVNPEKYLGIYNGEEKDLRLFEAIAIFKTTRKSIKSYIEFNEANKEQGKDDYPNIKYSDLPMSVSLCIRDIPAKKIWRNLLFDCDYNAKKINKEIENDFNDEINSNNKPNLKYFILYYHGMNREEFEMNFTKILKDLQMGKYLNYNEELREIVIKIDKFLEKGILPECDCYYSEYLNKFIKKYSSKIVALNEVEISNKEYKFKSKLLSLIDMQLNKISMDNRNKHIVDKLNRSFKANEDGEIALLFTSNPSEIYPDTPIMSCLNVDCMFDYLRTKPVGIQENFFMFFKNRYGIDKGELPEKFYPDETGIKRLAELYQEFYGNQGLLYNYNRDRYILLTEEYKKLAAYMKQQIEIHCTTAQ